MVMLWRWCLIRIGVVDTTFAMINMGDIAIDEIKKNAASDIVRRTVPGVKDIPVECKILIDEIKCDIVMALGMPGKEMIDKQCAHEASAGIISAQLMTNTHIIEVFVHEDEADTPKDLAKLAEKRTREHALNAIDLILYPKRLVKMAGTGQRQGGKDRGMIK